MASDNSICVKNRPHSSLTSEDVKTVIECVAGPTTKIIDYQVKPYSEERVGFLASHLCLNITIRRSGYSKDETLSFFIKCIPQNSEKQELLIRECQVFISETTFYKQILPELTKNYQGELWCPRCYLIKDDMLIFENLKPQNFTMFELPYDVPTLQSAITSLARFHAMTTVAEKRRGKTFYETHPFLFKEIVFDRDGPFKNLCKARIDLIVTLTKSQGYDTKTIMKYVDHFFEVLKPSSTRKNVICHGDLWPNNIMIDNSSPPRCRIVDYQVPRYLPMSCDLAQLVYLSTDRVFRDELEKSMISHYHQVFCETLQQNDDEIELPKLEEILQEYEEYRCYGLIIAAFYYPATLMNSTIRSELTKDSDSYDKFLNENKIDMVLEFMEKYADYKDRIMEVIVEIGEQAKIFE